MENKVNISSRHIEDFIYMSYRYCIGRHTGAAANHAETIHKLLVNNPDLLSEDRKEFMVKDIRQSINNVINWKKNVNVEFGDFDAFSRLLYALDGVFSTMVHKLDWTVGPNQIVYAETSKHSLEPGESFESEYTELIGWVRLANFLDKSCHKKIVVEYNEEREEYISYSYPKKKENGKYEKVWIDLESDISTTKWFDEQNIVEIKDL